ncbi:MAG TPA: HAD hydrolase-like protein [Candidatus Pacearchaeota archaeon]|nr:HAD hydrolase-like protein [Candidatus Pacearchaeota archaeon]HPR79932.1 HAD hydrolase-like protein [Candidatus Pacearchaeota archaeon]
MINLNEVELLIFDFDGTIFQTIKPEIEAVKRAFSELGLNLDNIEEKVRGYIGKTSEEAYKSILPPDKDLKWEELTEKVRMYRHSTILEYGEVFPDVAKTLQTLKERGYKIVLYSNASANYFKEVVSFLNIGKFFDYTECMEENNLTKAELIKKIRTRFAELNAAVVGDRIHDIEAAKENSIISVGALYGYNKEEAQKADLTISKFTDLLTIFDRKKPIFETILKEINKRKNGNKSFVVGISGIDTSGKTEFAEAFCQFLISKEFKVQVINLDDFHNPKAIRSSGDNQVDNYYNKGFDIKTIVEKLLMPISKNSNFSIKLTLLNLHTDEYETEKDFSFDKDTIVIFEGVFLFREELSPYIDYKIFIDIPFEESKNRAVVRDVPIFGEEIIKKYDEKYLPAQKKYLEEYPPIEVADIVIDNVNWEYPKIIHISKC